VFVLDTSGSMTGGRLEAAKRELISAINGLGDRVQFGLVVFNTKVGAWQKQLAPADARSKQAAAGFINRLPAQGTTASYDALELAFQFDAEAIYFLTDGVPNGGKVDGPEEIINLISRGNSTRRESIYTIGIGVGPEGSPFEWFLKTLAERNYGAFRRVDQ
jgi:Ca-activated chloride channel family protein